jgi:transcriptional regulator with XRE-family HTH domain
MTPISIKVKDLREQRGWSQIELSRRSGVPRITLSRIENGHTKGIDFETLEKLANALEVHPATLIERKGETREVDCGGQLYRIEADEHRRVMIFDLESQRYLEMPVKHFPAVRVSSIWKSTDQHWCKTIAAWIARQKKMPHGG